MNRSSPLFLCLCLCIFSAGVFGQSHEPLTVLEDSLHRVKDSEARYRILLELSEQYLKRDLEKSLDYATRATQLARKGIPRSPHEAYLARAEVFNLLDESDSCIHQLDNLLKLEQTMQDSVFWARVYRLYGRVLTHTGRYDEGRQQYNRALSLLSLQNEPVAKADVYNAIAISLKTMGQYDSAIFYLLLSNELAREQGDSLLMMKSMGNIAVNFFKIKNYDKARQYLEETLVVARLKKHTRFEAIVLDNLGNIYFVQEKYDSALLYYDQSMKLNLQTNDLPSLANNYGNKGAVFEGLKAYDTAVHYFNTALGINLKLGNVLGIVSNKSNIALIFERRGQYRKALALYDTVLQLAREYELPEQVAHTYFNLYKTYELMGDYKRAFEYQTRFHNLQDSLINLDRESMIEDLLMKYEKERDQARILALTNRTLEQDLEIRRKTNQRNIFSLVGLAVVITIFMVFLVARQRMIKDKIIRLKEIERLNEEKRAMAARALVEGQEEERKRVATELHDGIGVLLSSAKLQFTNIGEKLPENRDLFDRATSLLERASGDVRRISHNLMPGNLVRFGLFDSLEDMFDSLDETEGLEAQFFLEGLNDRLPENHEIMIYRMVQEMINNTLKHADASYISLSIKHAGDFIKLHYSDNGVGFNVRELEESGSLGLKSIQSRVDFLEGALQISSKPGQGSHFLIEIPLNVSK